MEQAINTLSSHQAGMHFDNGSIWDQFLNLTSTHLGVNVSRYTPSLEDLVWAGPRMVMRLGRLGSFISIPIPDAIDGFGQRVIPNPTASDIFSTASAGVPSIVTTRAPASAVPSGLADPDPVIHRFSMDGAKGLGSIFSYATSKWALCCIAMAVILNRTHVFAATRRRLRLSWSVRLSLRIVPLVMFCLQARSLLQSIQCQTSPDFAELRWGNASKSSDLMFAEHNPFLHGISSALLLGATDDDSCSAVHMIPVGDEDSSDHLRGSLSLLWPLFGTFCGSQFLETISCAVQGRPVAVETGMTLFEHSLAFSEADAAVSNQLGWGMFASKTTENKTKGAAVALSRAMILRRVNTSPEVLLIAFFSTMSHMTSHVLGVLGKQARFRLISTGFWAMCYMGSIMWSATTFFVEDPARQGLLRYPTISIISFIPHILILVGIIVCSSIYSVALLLSALAKPIGAGPTVAQLSLKERIAIAHANMQANLSFSDLRITMEMDFYTALLRAGIGAITMATEAVYLNEDRGINLKRSTWLEDERSREMEELKMNWTGSIPGSRYDMSGVIGLIPVKEGQVRASSGYARERAAQKLPRPSFTGERRQVGDGIGAAERSSRWLLALDYMLHINRLIITAWAMVVCSALSKLGVQNPPRWLKNRSQLPKSRQPEMKASGNSWSYESIVQPGHGSIGLVEIMRSDRIDVELELRQKYKEHEEFTDHASRERWIDNKLYHWWLAGGWWGKTDTSGDYAPLDEEDDADFDTTSVMSGNETVVSDGFGWEDVGSSDDGQHTPTQRLPFSSRASSPVVDNPMQTADLAALLHPRSAADREQARTLAAHLDSDGVMTRSSYRRFQQMERAQLLLAGTRAGVRAGIAKMTPDEEAQLLEQILLERRAVKAPDSGAVAGPATWATGATGMGPDAPQCVVCQCAPRTVIVWPCRCLSLCDDCRVSLAMNYFDKCVCCRRDVMSFSKIFVP